MPVQDLTVKMLSGSQLDKNAGQFVKTLAGRTGVGFADGFHVHRDWLATTISIDQGLEAIGKAEDERMDYIVSADDFDFANDGGRFVVKIDGKAFTPNDHSFPQMSMKIGVKSSSILREMNSNSPDNQDVDTMVTIAKNSMRHVKDGSKFFVRTYNDGTLRAWFTDSYAPICNRWYLEALKEFLPSARLSHWKSTEDTLWGNVLIPDSMKTVSDDDSDFGTMLSISNCEVGIRKFSMLPSIFRSICLNGCIWGRADGTILKRKHIGTINQDQLKLAIADSIKKQLPIASEAIDKFLETRSLTFGTNVKDTQLIGAICKEQKLKDVQSLRVLDAFEKLESHNRNLFGVVNAITRAGQSFNDPSKQFDFDVLGGTLAQININKWEQFNSIAYALKDSDLQEIFGVAV